MPFSTTARDGRALDRPGIYQFSDEYAKGTHPDSRRKGRGVFQGGHYVVPVRDDVDSMHPLASAWANKFLSTRPAWEKYRSIVVNAMIGLEDPRYAEFRDIVDEAVMHPSVASPLKVKELVEAVIAEKLRTELGITLEDWYALQRRPGNGQPAGGSGPSARVVDYSDPGYGSELPLEMASPRRQARLRR